MAPRRGRFGYCRGLAERLCRGPAEAPGHGCARRGRRPARGCRAAGALLAGPGRAHPERRAWRGQGIREGHCGGSVHPVAAAAAGAALRPAGKLEHALEQIERVVAEEPENIEALALSGRRPLVARSRRRSGRRATSRCSRSIPTSRKRTSTWARSTASAATLDRAVATLKKLIARNPTSILGYYYLGRVHAAAGQLDKAERYYLEALKLSPQSELILTDLAVAYELQGTSREGDRALRAHPRAEPARASSSAAAWAAIYVGQKRLDEALKQFRELEKIDADPREARTKIGLIYLEKGDLERAATEFNLVLAAEPEERARALLPRRRLRRAGRERSGRSRSSRRIPATSEYYVDARVQRAYLLQKDDRRDAPSKEIEQALEAKPDNAGADELSRRRSTASRRTIRRRHRAARAASSRRSPTTTATASRSAPPTTRRRTASAAIEQMQRAIELNPKNAAALNYLGYTYAEMGVKLDEAESLIRRALEIEPDDGFYIDSLGWVYFQRGDYPRADRAARARRRARRRRPDRRRAPRRRVRDARAARDDALRVYRDALGRAKESGADRAAEGQDPRPRATAAGPRAAALLTVRRRRVRGAAAVAPRPRCWCRGVRCSAPRRLASGARHQRELLAAARGAPRGASPRCGRARGSAPGSRACGRARRCSSSGPSASASTCCRRSASRSRSAPRAARCGRTRRSRASATRAAPARRTSRASSARRSPSRDARRRPARRAARARRRSAAPTLESRRATSTC